MIEKIELPKTFKELKSLVGNRDSAWGWREGQIKIIFKYMEMQEMEESHQRWYIFYKTEKQAEEKKYSRRELVYYWRELTF